jgi:sugar phosphate isomerase/epimerase
MQLGIFAKTFSRSTLPEIFRAVTEQGLSCVQFNMTCAGLPSMPDQIEPGIAKSIHQEALRQGVTIAAVSGTFNMVDPDIEKRKAGLRRLRVLAGACHELGTSVITLCTGSRDPNSMWARHQDNDSKEAWADLLVSMAEALEIAKEANVTLAIEPEVSNVVDSAAKARRLLDEMKSTRLRVVMDGANLFHAGELPQMHRVLEEGFELLGRDIILAHAKDLSEDGAAGHEAAGTGLLDYDHYLFLLHASGFAGPLIMHNLTEKQVPFSRNFLAKKLCQIENQIVA